MIPAFHLNVLLSQYPPRRSSDAGAIAVPDAASSEDKISRKSFDISHDKFTDFPEKKYNLGNFRSVPACGANSLYGFLTLQNKIKLGSVIAFYIDPAYVR